MEKTAVEWLDNQIDDELKVIDNLYGKEIMGRKIGLAFVKRILVQAKEMEKQHIIDAYFECWKVNMPDGFECKLSAKEYYNQTFKQD